MDINKIEEMEYQELIRIRNRIVRNVNTEKILA